MTQEEKQFLLADLCARLPYRVKVQIDFGEHCIKYGIDRYVDDTVICVWPETFEIGVNDEDQACDIEDVKPYLRPMSSMTEDEFGFLQEHLPYDFTRIYSGKFDIINDIHLGNSISIDDMAFLLDYLDKYHFDYRGLIEKGLALEAPEGMYNTKTE